MQADFVLEADGRTTPIPEVGEGASSFGHGGARDGAGRKPKGYQKAPEVVEFEKARARNEAAKAAMNELEFKIKSGEYVSRAAVQQAAATAIAAFAQTGRSIGDNLERKGVPPDICQKVEQAIDDAFADLSTSLEMMSGGGL